MTSYEKLYFIEREAIAIVERVNNTTYRSPSEVKEITLHVTKEDETFVSDDTSSSGIGMHEQPNIPEEFHEVLAHKVIQEGYQKKPEQIQLAVYFKQAYNEGVMEAKRYANKDLDGSNYHIIGHDF